MKKQVKCETRSASQEQADARFREYINRQSELRNLYAEQQAIERERKLQKNEEKRIIARIRTLLYNGITMFLLGILLYAAQAEGLISPSLSVPAMIISFGSVVWCVSGIYHIRQSEPKKAKGRYFNNKTKGDY